MKSRTLLPLAGLLTLLLPGLAFAGQTPTPAAPGTHVKTKTVRTTTTVVKTTNSVHGVVKGAPTGNTFVVARRGGTVTVDASGATIKNRTQPATMAVIKGGTIVTAHGTMQGSVFKATDVVAYPRTVRVKKTTTTTTTTTTGGGAGR